MQNVLPRTHADACSLCCPRTGRTCQAALESKARHNKLDIQTEGSDERRSAGRSPRPGWQLPKGSGASEPPHLPRGHWRGEIRSTCNSYLFILTIGRHPGCRVHWFIGSWAPCEVYQTALRRSPASKTKQKFDKHVFWRGICNRATIVPKLLEATCLRIAGSYFGWCLILEIDAALSLGCQRWLRRFPF